MPHLVKVRHITSDHCSFPDRTLTVMQNKLIKCFSVQALPDDLDIPYV